MIVVSIIRSVLSSSIVFLSLLCNHTIFSLRLGSILNTRYAASAANGPYLNMTCMQCSCTVADTNVVGWNCLANGSQCQVIGSYSSSDAGLKSVFNSTFYFQKLPPEPLLTAAQTTTDESSTIISTVKMTTSGTTLRWNQSYVVIADSSASLDEPNGIAIDPVTSAIFVADKCHSLVKKFLPGFTNGQTIASSALADLDEPLALAWLNDTGALFIASSGNDRIMRILTKNGSLNATRVAGTGGSGSSLSQVTNPSGVAVDKTGTYLYVADRGSNRVLRWNLMNLTAAGTLIAGSSVSNINGTLNKPHSLALNQQGTALFIADRDNNRIQKVVLDTGVMTTAAGHADGSITSDAYGLEAPEAIALDSLDNLYVADKAHHRIQMFCKNSLNGTNILQGFDFDTPSGIAIDASFNLYVSDTGHDRVLKFVRLP